MDERDCCISTVFTIQTDLTVILESGLTRFNTDGASAICVGIDPDAEVAML